MTSKTLLAAAVAVALSASSVLAEDKVAMGAIDTVDMDTNTITLVDGQSFSVPDDVDVTKVKPGDEVIITWDTIEQGVDEGKQMINNITLSQR